jgi:membrane associated rhomboid family serine protease
MRGKVSATLALAAITGVVSLLIIVANQLGWASYALGFIPLRASTEVAIDSLPVWLTPLSATLVHAGFLHLVMNLLLLVWCGKQVEGLIGPGPLVVLYVAGAYAAAAGHYVMDPMSDLPMVGASGAVSALIGAFAISFSRPKRIVQSFRLNRAINVVWLMVAWVVLQWMMGLLMGFQGVLVATAAHVGGFVAGVALQKPLLLWRYRKA